MLIILYLSLGQRSSWWAPILTGSFSAIWGLGFVSLMGYNFDPVMLVIPFILTARDLSHGIQWQGRYYDELDRLDDKLLACATTTDVMLPPGLLSILADIAGIIFISFGGIPVLKEIGLRRRGMAGVEPDDGVRLSTDLHELSAAAADSGAEMGSNRDDHGAARHVHGILGLAQSGCR